MSLDNIMNVDEMNNSLQKLNLYSDLEKKKLEQIKLKMKNMMDDYSSNSQLKLVGNFKSISDNIDLMTLKRKKYYETINKSKVGYENYSMLVIIERVELSKID